MVTRRFMIGLVLVGLACGGDGGEDAAPPADAAPAAQNQVAQGGAGAAVATGVVHDIRMLLTDDGRYVYEPAELTIRAGDAVRWINVSGGPHNVAFYPDKIPAGAASVLNAAMANKMSALTGELMIQEDQAYEISFAGAPAGTYEYFCTPHEMLGMVAKLTVTN